MNVTETLSALSRAIAWDESLKMIPVSIISVVPSTGEPLVGGGELTFLELQHSDDGMWRLILCCDNSLQLVQPVIVESLMSTLLQLELSEYQEAPVLVRFHNVPDGARAVDEDDKSAVFDLCTPLKRICLQITDPRTMYLLGDE